MKKANIVIVDYGMGNLLSVSRAFAHCGAHVTISSDPSCIERAEYLVLPGVGAFADGMAGLRELSLVDPIRRFVQEGRPFLGICLGMQMMLDTSEEFGTHEGLCLIPGKVVAIPPTRVDGLPQKIPHIGWAGLMKPSPSVSWDKTILAGISEGESAYFVHSYTAVPALSDYRLADCSYGGRIISAVIRSGSSFGCQFHPEKSGEVGLGIIRRFLSLSE